MGASKSRISPEHQALQYLHQPEKLAAVRADYPLHLCRSVGEAVARRVAESRRQFPWKFFRGDCHCHSQHSDGTGTVAEIADMSKRAGLDFQFVTDHYGTTQADECRRLGLWVGQEPGTQHHDLLILGLRAPFQATVTQNFLADYAAAARRSALVCVAHPAGWWPSRWYDDAQKQILEELPSPFLMEICNGANNIVTAFDPTDQAAVDLWDDLLLQGKVVHGLGNTDAHAPHGIGIVWNGVFAPRCDQPAIIRALRAGRSFVSEAPLVHIRLGRAQMGRRATPRDRSQRLSVTATDSGGLASVRVVADRREIGFWTSRATTMARSLRVPRWVKRYVRVEVLSRDGRRAFSNPIYLTRA